MPFRPCAIDGCTADADTHKGGSRGWCQTHYARWRRHGDPLHGGEVIRQSATGTPCVIEECEKSSVARGLCENHYRRWKRYGDPVAGKPSPGKDPAERFWSKVDQNAPASTFRPDLGPCWLWTDAPNSAGYGTFKVGGETLMAHRFAWTLAGRALTPGLTLDHLCRVQLCVRVEHLEEVTHAENHARRLAATN